MQLTEQPKPIRSRFKNGIHQPLTNGVCHWHLWPLCSAVLHRTPGLYVIFICIYHCCPRMENSPWAVITWESLRSAKLTENLPKILKSFISVIITWTALSVSVIKPYVLEKDRFFSVRSGMAPGPKTPGISRRNISSSYPTAVKLRCPLFLMRVPETSIHSTASCCPSNLRSNTAIGGAGVLSQELRHIKVKRIVIHAIWKPLLFICSQRRSLYNLYIGMQLQMEVSMAFGTSCCAVSSPESSMHPGSKITKSATYNQDQAVK